MIQFVELWRAHPLNRGETCACCAPSDTTNALGQFVRKGEAMYANQAAIRLGIALNRAGVNLADFGRLQTCGVHAAKDMHILNPIELANALDRAGLPGIGRHETISGADVQKFYPKLFGRTGIIYIQDYWMRETDPDGRPTGDHIDLWNGYRSSAKWLMEWFSWAGYYSEYKNAREIWFWEVG